MHGHGPIFSQRRATFTVDFKPVTRNQAEANAEATGGNATANEKEGGKKKKGGGGGGFSSLFGVSNIGINAMGNLPVGNFSNVGPPLTARFSQKGPGFASQKTETLSVPHIQADIRLGGKPFLGSNLRQSERRGIMIVKPIVINYSGSRSNSPSGEGVGSGSLAKVPTMAPALIIPQTPPTIIPPPPTRKEPPIDKAPPVPIPIPIPPLEDFPREIPRAGTSERNRQAVETELSQSDVEEIQRLKEMEDLRVELEQAKREDSGGGNPLGDHLCENKMGNPVEKEILKAYTRSVPRLMAGASFKFKVTGFSPNFSLR